MTATARAIIFGAIGSLFLAGLPLIAAVGPAGGSQQGPQVINGSNAAAGAWPAMAAIGYRGESAKRGGRVPVGPPANLKKPKEIS